MVSEQQQAILARGKQIAKDVNQTYEEKLTALNDIKGYITCASNEVIAVSEFPRLAQFARFRLQCVLRCRT